MNRNESIVFRHMKKMGKKEKNHAYLSNDVYSKKSLDIWRQKKSQLLATQTSKFEKLFEKQNIASNPRTTDELIDFVFKK